ncbi:MAG: MFS transporter [Gammaproteobacteria bacterium]|nr:MFS transporter [Gammaproteobacteria bacterium]
MNEAVKEHRSWREAFAVYLHRRVLVMLFLGFSSGLPLPLVFSTFGTWLRDVGVTPSTIGFLSAVGLAYALKFLWAPVVDRLKLPILHRLFGQRRSWMIFAQVMVAFGLLLMAITDPQTQLAQLALAAVMVAFFSATQDIAIDAYRIEAVDPDRQGAMAAMYIYGYRIAMIASVAGALYVATFLSWGLAYAVMAVCMGVGFVTALLIAEPERQVSALTLELEARMNALLKTDPNAASTWKRLEAWFAGAVVGPFAEFFARNGKRAFVLVALISVYLMSDYLLGVMSGPFYIDMGYSKIEIANVAKLFGLAVTIFAAFIGGLLVARYGIMRMLLVGAVLLAVTNLGFAWLAASGKAEIWRLAVVIMADNLSGGMANVVFIAFMSSITNVQYTATQYALFSSLMKVPGKLTGLFSGELVEAYGYAEFFMVAAASGIPAILLVIYLMRTASDEEKERWA